MGGKPPAPGAWWLWGEGNRLECALSSPWGEEVGRMMLALPSSSFCCLLSASRAGRPGRWPRCAR